MTFAIAIATRQAVVVAADRKYSGVGSLSKLLGTKLCRMETPDAHGIMTYAGVGARAYAAPLEVSTWVQNLLAGTNPSFDQAMAEVAQAATEQGMAAPRYHHSFMFAGFVGGHFAVELITADTEVDVSDSSGKSQKVLKPDGSDFFRIRLLPPPHGVASGAVGTGKAHMTKSMLRGVIKDLRRSSKTAAYRSRVMARMAWVVRQISGKDPLVSPEAVCAWSGWNKGGEHKAYDAEGAVEHGSWLPAVVTGLPVNALADALWPVAMEWFEKTRQAKRKGETPPPFDCSETELWTAGG